MFLHFLHVTLIDRLDASGSLNLKIPCKLLIEEITDKIQAHYSARNIFLCFQEKTSHVRKNLFETTDFGTQLTNNWIQPAMFINRLKSCTNCWLMVVISGDKFCKWKRYESRRGTVGLWFPWLHVFLLSSSSTLLIHVRGRRRHICIPQYLDDMTNVIALCVLGRNWY